MKKLYTMWACLLLAALVVPGMSFAQDISELEVVRHNTSQPLSAMSMPELAQGSTAPYAIPNKFMKFGSLKNPAEEIQASIQDEVLQNIMGSGSVDVRKSFEGSSDADNGALLGFLIVPPDTDGDVGPKHYVQWINLVAEIYDKKGNTILGPFPGNLFFQGLGGICENTNNGDPIVMYDEGADRWNVSQFALDFDNTNFSMCIAVSTTGDPTGSYHQYELNFGTVFPDYPKLGIWGDSYTLTTRNFVGASGQFAVVMDREAMLNGEALRALITTIPRDFFADGYVPMDTDDPDVSGAPLFGGHTAFGKERGMRNEKEFELFEFFVNWDDNPLDDASFTKVAEIPLPAYNIGGAPYVDQPNGQFLDDLDSFTMHRAHVRQFDTYRAMVANHTIKLNPGTAAVRWYEFRDYGSGWDMYQAGTYSPDNRDRWMGSIAMNKYGDISLGYSLSGKSTYPSVAVTGQTADYSGTGIMNVAETIVQAGGGSQEDASRWGDYSMMSVDPRDERTFWYTAEYYAETGAFDFKTNISAFRLKGGKSALADGGSASPDVAGQLIAEVPTEFSIEQNYPNPFNPTTMINFAMPEAGNVSVKVFNMLGQEVATVVDGVLDAGVHTVSFDAQDLSAGVYLYVMEAGEYTATRRMTLLK